MFSDRRNGSAQSIVHWTWFIIIIITNRFISTIECKLSSINNIANKRKINSIKNTMRHKKKPNPFEKFPRWMVFSLFWNKRKRKYIYFVRSFCIHLSSIYEKTKEIQNENDVYGSNSHTCNLYFSFRFFSSYFWRVPLRIPPRFEQ